MKVENEMVIITEEDLTQTAHELHDKVYYSSTEEEAVAYIYDTLKNIASARIKGETLILDCGNSNI